MEQSTESTAAKVATSTHGAASSGLDLLSKDHKIGRKTQRDREGAKSDLKGLRYSSVSVWKYAAAHADFIVAINLLWLFNGIPKDDNALESLNHNFLLTDLNKYGSTDRIIDTLLIETAAEAVEIQDQCKILFHDLLKNLSDHYWNSLYETLSEANKKNENMTEREKEECAYRHILSRFSQVMQLYENISKYNSPLRDYIWELIQANTVPKWSPGFLEKRKRSSGSDEDLAEAPPSSRPRIDKSESLEIMAEDLSSLKEKQGMLELQQSQQSSINANLQGGFVGVEVRVDEHRDSIAELKDQLDDAHSKIEKQSGMLEELAAMLKGNPAGFADMRDEVGIDVDQLSEQGVVQVVRSLQEANKKVNGRLGAITYQMTHKEKGILAKIVKEVGMSEDDLPSRFSL